MRQDRAIVLAIFAVFFVESAVLGNWIPRIPDVKANLGLSDGMLGMCLLAIPFGTMAGLFVAGRVVERIGLRTACQAFLPLWAILFLFPSLAGTAWQLGFLLFLCGCAVGLIEVAMNTEADRIETVVKTRIMSRCHGFWSLGSMAGALMGSLMAQIGLSVFVHFLIIMPILAVAGWYAATCLPRNDDVENGDVEKSASGSEAALFRLPSRAVLLLCFMPLGIMSVEGAFIDWSAVFMRSILEASPLVIGVAYSFFSGIMAVTRLSGDYLAERFGNLTIVRCSGLAATAGITLFALAPTVPVAFFAAALAGMGVAIVYPLAMTAAARRPARSPADNVAALTMVSFCAFLFAPPIIGFLSDVVGLRMALVVLGPIAFTTVLLAGEVVPVKVQGTKQSSCL